MTTAIFYHEDCALHDQGQGHPEQPLRTQAIVDALQGAKLWDRFLHLRPTLGRDSDITRVHPQDYLDFIYANAPAQGTAVLDGDTIINQHSVDVARLGVGAACQAVDQVLEGPADNAFVLMRPPGHHAERDKAMGFCLFGNAAIAAAYALSRYDLQRVAILDFDVHHGNGTEDLVQDDPRILFCSSFQSPLFPGYFGADIEGQRVNSPLPAGADGQQWRRLWQQQWRPTLDEFKPQLIIISAGFDAHRDDPLANLGFDEADFAWITEAIAQLAARHASGAIVSLLEGGYNLRALGLSACAHLEMLLNQNP